MVPKEEGAEMTRLCRKCGLAWNVSVLEPGPRHYICPRCERKKPPRELALHRAEIKKNLTIV